MSYKCLNCEADVVVLNEEDFICPICGYTECEEFEWMNEKQDEILADFFNKGEGYLISPFAPEEIKGDESAGYIYMWEDFAEAKQFANENPEVFIYTLVDCDEGEAWITDGWHFCNRLGYFFSTKDLEIPDEGIRYW